MPSIFNHENACWGVKKSFSNLLHCDFNDDFQTRKLGLVIGAHPSSTNSVKYSVSSNGYYGYQPHSNVQNQSESCDNNAMDIDVNNIPASQFIQTPQESKGFVLSPTPNIQVVNRKRQMTGDLIEDNKRMRPLDIAEISLQTSTCNSHQGDGVGSRLILLRGQLSRTGENETTAELLRLTHGCEDYLFERSCDY